MAVLLTLGSVSSAAASNCSKAAMERDPASVVAPCTSLLETKGLTNAQRAEALRVRADGYDRTKRRREGLTDYEESLKAAPRNADTMMSAAWTAWALGEHEKVSTLVERALKVEPGNARALDLVGFYFVNSGSLPEGIQAFTAALKTDPRQPFALLHRADAYHSLGRFAEALADLTVLTSFKKEELSRFPLRDQYGNVSDFHAFAFWRRGEELADMHNYKEAIRDYDIAITQAPGDASYRSSRADAKLRSADMDGAIADADGALAIDPRQTSALSTKARALSIKKRPDQALAVIDQALALRPNAGSLWVEKASILKYSGNTEAAVDLYVKAYTALPGYRLALTRGIVFGGYLSNPALPAVETPELRDAFTACVLDPKCI